MSDLDRSRSRPPRKTREQRAYRLVLAGGVFGAVAVVGFLLAIVSSFPGWVPFLAAVLAVICVLLFRSTVSRR